MGKADANHDCVLSFDEFIECYNELVDLLSPPKPPDAAAITASSRKAGVLPELKDVHSLIQSGVHSTFTDLESAFAALDPTGSGQIPNEMFVDVLKQSGLPVPPEDIAILVAAYDANGDGSVSHAEFAAAMSANGGRAVRIDESAGPNAIARVMAAEEALRGKIHERYETVTSAFLGLDKDYSGYLDAFEFQRLLYKFGIEVSEQDMEVLLQRFDANHDGKMDVHELASFLQPAAYEQWNNKY